MKSRTDNSRLKLGLKKVLVEVFNDYKLSKKKQPSYEIKYVIFINTYKFIDTEMRNLEVFIRVRSKYLEPFYYLLASKLPKRIFFPRKKGEPRTKTVYSTELPMARRYLKSKTIRDGTFLFL